MNKGLIFFVVCLEIWLEGELIYSIMLMVNILLFLLLFIIINLFIVLERLYKWLEIIILRNYCNVGKYKIENL